MGAEAIVFIFALVVIIFLLVKYAGNKSAEAEQYKSKTYSQRTVHGQTMERFIPFMNDWPWNRKDYRSLGTPIDGIQFDFDNEEIIFVEVKTGDAQLTDRERVIKRIIERGNVRFEEIRV